MVFETFDGQRFTNEIEADEHEDDIVGQPLFEARRDEMVDIETTEAIIWDIQLKIQELRDSVE